MAAAFPARAILGVGDVVVVAADPAQEMLWASEELPQWLNMIQKAETQIQQAKEIVSIAGHPKDFAQQIVNDAQPALAVTVDANSLQTSSDLIDFAQSSWSLYKSVPKNLKGNLDVSESFQIFDETVSRDKSLYTGMASEKALRSRLDDAISKKRAVDTQELAYQQRTLTALSAASTQSEVALHQAGLAASNQRMEIAAARMQQAQGELNSYVGDAQLEVRKTQQMQTEEAQHFIDAALSRANAAAAAPAPDTL
jgi:hypothetical protein